MPARSSRRSNADPDIAVQTRQQDRLAAKILREAERRFVGPRPADQADGLLVEQVIAKGRAGVALGGAIGENDVDGMGFELREQVARRAGAHDQFHIRATDQGTQELKLEVARQGRQRADPQDLAACERPPFKGAHQLVAGLEDGVGIIERDLTGLGQDEPLADTFEQRVTHLVFEFLDLHR